VREMTWGRLKIKMSSINEKINMKEKCKHKK
jgi:hypothetical protein